MGCGCQSRYFDRPEAVTPEGVRVGAHSNLPVDAVPYTGPRYQYCLINVEAKLTGHATFLSAALITTNIDNYYPTLCQPYADGFIMKQFQAIPYVQTQAALSFSLKVPYEAMLCKPINMAPSHERWQLRVEKSFLQTQLTNINYFTHSHTTQSDTSDIFQKINSVVQQGGRLICIEITGHQRGPTIRQQYAGHMGVKGVDLFFNMPLHQNPTFYTYQAVSVPIQYQITGYGSATIEVLTDFMAQFAAFLQKGWKLVEINFDSSMSMQVQFLRANSAMNSIWFFEKEVSKINSEVPEWEGTVVHYEHKIARKCGGTRATTNWDPILIEMGQQGWELACLLESPEIYRTGCSTAGIKVIMFFQRPIMRPAGETSGFSAASPPSYSEVSAL